MCRWLKTPFNGGQIRAAAKSDLNEMGQTRECPSFKGGHLERAVAERRLKNDKGGENNAHHTWVAALMKSNDRQTRDHTERQLQNAPVIIDSGTCRPQIREIPAGTIRPAPITGSNDSRGRLEKDV